MKIKFVCNHLWFSDPRDTHNSQLDEKCVLNMAFFFIKHYYDLHGLNKKKVKWMLADLIAVENFDSQIKKLFKDPPDLLALSVFIWNEKTQFKIAKEFKKKYPNKKVIVGGPQLTAHKDENFFKVHPYIDYVVYGDGEKPIQQIIDHEFGLLQDRNQFVNIVTLENKKYKKYPYEMINDHLYLSTSTFLGQQKFIMKHIDYLVKKGIPKRNIKIAVEFARGCMYDCSFCDWSQNLTKKVKRRSSNWKKELDFFKKIDIPIRETDANFGQWKEDIEIFDYANSIYDPDKNFYFIPKNTPKLKKASTFYIMKKVFEVYEKKLFPQFISFQDINVDVLNNINRPSLTFQEHIEFVKNLKQQTNIDISNLLNAVIMVGLPGQTYDTFCKSIQKIYNESEIKKIVLIHWEFLPNSPAADVEYKKKFKIKTIPAVYLTHYLNLEKEQCFEDLKTIDKLYQKVHERKYVNHYFAETNFIHSTKDISFIEINACKILLRLLESPLIKNKKNFLLDDKNLRLLKDLSLEKSKKMLESYDLFEKKYNFLIHAEYNETKKILFPSNIPLIS